MKLTYHIIILTGLLLFSCKEERISSTNGNEYSEDSGTTTPQPLATQLVSSKGSEGVKFDGVRYSVNGVSAIDYIQRSGKKISKEDLNDLKTESVFIVELTSEDVHHNIFENDKLLYDKDKAVQYLIGEIQNDFKLKQKSAIITINGVSYEGQTGLQNKIRVVFYAKGIDLNKPYQVEYYDRLFGKGLIKFKRTQNEIIS